METGTVQEEKQPDVDHTNMILIVDIVLMFLWSPFKLSFFYP
jgi:hypothetical protein